MIDWALYPNFSKKEFDCTHCGANQMTPAFMAKLQAYEPSTGNPFGSPPAFVARSTPLKRRKSNPAHMLQWLCL
jgi:hypothetical protein